MGQSYTMNADWWPKKFKKNYEKQAYSHKNETIYKKQL